MSDISKKVLSIDPGSETDPEPIDVPSIEDDVLPIVSLSPRSNEEDDDPRPILELVEEIDVTDEDVAGEAVELDAENAPIVPLRPVVRSVLERPAPISPAPVRVTPEAVDLNAEAPKRARWIVPTFALATALAVALLSFAYLTEAGEVSALGLAGLILATFVPMAVVFAYATTVRAAAEMRGETVRLSQLVQRMTRPDETAGTAVSNLSNGIRRELAHVDTHLEQSRERLGTLATDIERQSSELDALTESMAERSSRISETIAEQTQAFATLSDDFGTRMNELSELMDRQRTRLSDTTDASEKRVKDAADAMARSTELTREHGAEIDTSARSVQQTVEHAETRLAALSETIARQTAELDDFFARRIEAMTTLSDRLSSERPIAEKALYAQTESLGAVDAQIEITEGRLNDLVSHIRSIQTQFSERLSDINDTLGKADSRSRDFTADIADRVSDSVAQTRQEMSIMEGELKSLQNRMESASKSIADDATSSSHLDLQSYGLHDPLTIPNDDNDTPQAVIETLPESDIVQRPTDPATGVFGRRRPGDDNKNWQWRDMLGSIEPMDPLSATAPTPTNAGIQRPGPGIPLSAPPPQEFAPTAPDGSDVVARLCEVELAPSAVLDKTTIRKAAAARKSGGETAQARAVFDALNAPVIHLRGVLSADLEFRLRAEGFRRSYDSYLNALSDPARKLAELSSAQGRAYLLCCAALSAT